MDHLSIVFIGHVDAGKSTTSGQILLSTGQIDERLIEKYSKEAEDKKHSSWYLAYLMDSLEEERAKGKTVEVGRATFSTKVRRYTILDAPGHNNYIPNMILGVAQADIGILLISARKGEFEAGFEKNGQTREHAWLAKALGVRNLIVAINKMDDPTVNWDKIRYDSIVNSINTFLLTIGYKNTIFLPISGLNGINIFNKSNDKWYNGNSLLTILDNLPQLKNNQTKPLRIPILDRFKDMGIIAMGKVEQGTLNCNQQYIIIPSNTLCEVVKIENEFGIFDNVKNGENVNITLKGIDENLIHQGDVLCEISSPINVVTEFVAQLILTNLPQDKVLFTIKSSGVFHSHTNVSNIEVVKILAEQDKKTGEIITKLPKYVKSNSVSTIHFKVEHPICLETFKDNPIFGRFVLRDEGLTIGFGKVLHLGYPKKIQK